MRLMAWLKYCFQPTLVKILWILFGCFNKKLYLCSRKIRNIAEWSSW